MSDVAKRLREIYGLPPIIEKPDPDCIKELCGMIKDDDPNFSATEFIRNLRDGLYDIGD